MRSKFPKKLLNLLCLSTLLGFTITPVLIADKAQADTDLKPLRLYWSGDYGDNFSTGTREGADAARSSDYSYEGIEACILSEEQPGTVPLVSFWGSDTQDNFTTATQAGVRVAQSSGYDYIRIEGYVFSDRQPGTVPLELYWGSDYGDNFTTARSAGADAALRSGYQLIRTEGYVYPASRCS